MNKTFLILGLVVLLIGALWWVFSANQTTVVSVVDTVATEGVSEASIKIIAFGDSLTAGYGVAQSEAYPAQLEVALRNKGYDVLVINSGVSGETTRGNLERANFIRSQNPDIVILGIGGNDALRALPIQETEKNLRATLAVLTGGAQSPHVLLLQMQAPLNAGSAYKDQFDALYETIATEYDAPLVPFLTEELFLDNTNKLPDGIHYNATGYKRVTEKHILPALEAVLVQ